MERSKKRNVRRKAVNPLEVRARTASAIDDALRVLGDPSPSKACLKTWYFEIHGIVCRLYSTGHELVLNVERGTLLNMRMKVVDDVTMMLKENG